MANTYLTKTLGTATNRKKFTISLWTKRSNISVNNAAQLMTVGTNGSSNIDEFNFYNTTDQLSFQGYESSSQVFQIRTNQKFRDTSGFYHIVVAYDSTQGTASNRIKMYINGTQVTSVSHSNYPSQNHEPLFNSNVPHLIGRYIGSSNYYSGIVSHINFIDGTAYAPTAFGETDATTGEWKIKSTPSVTYGNNGFFILKDGNSVTDQSGKSNNFSVGGGTLTKTEDSPSNVFCTWNPLIKTPHTLSYYRGNLDISAEGNSWYSTQGTIGFSQGKFYFECTDLSEQSQIGVTNPNIHMNESLSINLAGTTLFYNADGGEMRKDGTNTSANYGTFNSTDIMGVAIDMDNKRISIYKNNSAIVTNYAFSTSITDTAIPYVGLYGSGNLVKFNFGNGYFGTTAVSSAGTNASGNGIFEHNVPSGFTALSTEGLNL